MTRPVEQRSRTAGVELSRTQGTWRKKARELAQTVLAPRAAEVDRAGVFPQDNIRALGEGGFLGLAIPEHLGGVGADVLTTALVTQELARGCAATAMCFHMHTSTVPLVAALAEGDQVDRFVAPIARGEWLGAIAMSEPGSGSRVWHTDSAARPDGDDFVLDAKKSFVTNGGHADYYIVVARSSPTAAQNDLSLFLVERDRPGITCSGGWDAMGLRGCTSGPMQFQLRVPASHRLGDADSGFPMIVAFNFPIYQVGLSAVYLGVAQASLDAAIKHVAGRVHADTGAPLASVESVQRYLGEMRVRLDQGNATLHRVARIVDRAVRTLTELAGAGLLTSLMDQVLKEDDLFVEVAALKVAACETAIAVSNAALQICGGAGFKRGHVVERCYRDARAGSVMAPSDDALKLLIGKQLLGAPFPWDEART